MKTTNARSFSASVKEEEVTALARQALEEAILCKPKMHGVLDADHQSEAGRRMHTIGG